MQILTHFLLPTNFAASCSSINNGSWAYLQNRTAADTVVGNIPAWRRRNANASRVLWGGYLVCKFQTSQQVLPKKGLTAGLSPNLTVKGPHVKLGVLSLFLTGRGWRFKLKVFIVLHPSGKCPKTDLYQVFYCLEEVNNLLINQLAVRLRLSKRRARFTSHTHTHTHSHS